VASTTSTAEIESAYRKASLRHHPDKLPNEQKAEGQLRFVALTDAKDTLVDPVRRQQYDRQWAEYQASLHKNAKAKRTKLSTTERKLQKEAAQKRKENFEAMKARWAAKTEEEQRAACRAQPRPAPTGFTSMPQIQ
jgi:DnaJ-class molecular chaperone